MNIPTAVALSYLQAVVAGLYGSLGIYLVFRWIRNSLGRAERRMIGALGVLFCVEGCAYAMRSYVRFTGAAMPTGGTWLTLNMIAALALVTFMVVFRTSARKGVE